MIACRGLGLLSCRVAAIILQKTILPVIFVATFKWFDVTTGMTIQFMGVQYPKLTH